MQLLTSVCHKALIPFPEIQYVLIASLPFVLLLDYINNIEENDKTK